MDINTFLKTLKKRQAKVWIFVLIFLIIASVASFSQSLKYQATSRLLIIQDGAASDPYTISKSNQYLSSLLSEAVYSSSFFDLLVNSETNIDWGYFNGDYKQQIKKWKKTVLAKNINDTGVLEVQVYHPDQEQAKKIAEAINNLLITQNNLYQGSNSNLKLKIIDQPLVSSWPVKPNLILNFGGALVFGLLFSFIYIYYFPVSQKSLKVKIQTPIKVSQPKIQPEPVKISYHENPEPRVGNQLNNFERSEEEIIALNNKYREQQNLHFSGNIKNIMN